MNSPEKTPVIIAVGDFASGVTSWALRLREALAARDTYTVLLMNCTDTRNRVAEFDLHATSQTGAREVLNTYHAAIVIPNFVWDLFPVCAALNATGRQFRCIGFCRADSEKEYYAPLRWYAPLISTFAAVSPACTEAVAAYTGTDIRAIHTLPTGVWVPPTLDRPYATAPIRIAYGGRIVQEQKRILDFVPLVEALYRRQVDFRFDIAGAGQQLEELRAAITMVDPEGRVRFVPRMKPEAMAAFWAAHDIFVQASEYEGTSNSMLESMAQGAVPVLTETFSGVDEIIRHGENGFLVPIGDMVAMADAIAALAADPDSLARLGAAAHTSTRPFAMERYVEKFTRLLDVTMATPPGVWPADRPITPPAPFYGIRLAPDAVDTTHRGRIAIVFPSPLRGGAEDYTLKIAEGAVRAGYDVQGAFPGKAELKSLIQDYFRAGAFHNTLEICDVGPKSGQALFHKRFTRTVRLLRRLKPKAVLFMLCGMQYGLLSLMGCAALRMPALVVFQLVRNDIRLSFFRRAFYRWMRGRGQCYVAVSEANRKLLASAFRMNEDEILIIPNGVDMDRFAYTADAHAAARLRLREALGLSPETLLCLTVGRLSHQKGHDVLVPAIPHIVARFPNAHFLWAGDGPLEKRLRALLETYHVSEHVTLLGRCENMPDLLHACDLFIHPARFEGQPFSLLEAMAAGLPAVTTSASGIAEVIDDGVQGLLCRPDDIASLRDAVLRTLSNPDDMKRMADAAREKVRAFSEAAMVEKTLAALDARAAQR